MDGVFAPVAALTGIWMVALVTAACFVGALVRWVSERVERRRRVRTRG